MTAYDNLSSFLSELEGGRDLVRVPVEVDPVLELAEITDRVCRSAGDGGPVLFFERVKGSSLPVIVNLLGSDRRICRALRVKSLDEATQRIAGLFEPELPEDWLDSVKLLPQWTQLTRLPPTSVKSGVCQQVVKMGSDVDLQELPIPTGWPGDAAAAITAGQVYTANLQTGARDMGMFPLEFRDKSSLFVHWNEHEEGFRNYQRYRQQERQMPVAIALGGDPVLTYVANAPLPANTDGCLFAGFLRGSNVELVKCRSIDLEVPAHAEVVIEGLIDTAVEPETAGPLGLFSGFYSLPEPLPIIQVTAVTHRSNPVFPALIAGKPYMEEHWIGRATERMLLPFVRLHVPEIVDFHRPRCGTDRNLLFVSIQKHYPQQARKVINALWGIDGVATTKIVVVVDADVDVHNEEDVWFHVGAHVHPGRDVLFCEGPTHMHDHAAPVRGMGHKLGIDATRKLPEEGHPRPWPEPVRMNQDVQDLVARRWGEYGFEGL